MCLFIILWFKYSKSYKEKNDKEKWLYYDLYHWFPVNIAQDIKLLNKSIIRILLSCHKCLREISRPKCTVCYQYWRQECVPNELHARFQSSHVQLLNCAHESRDCHRSFHVGTLLRHWVCRLHNWSGRSFYKDSTVQILRLQPGKSTSVPPSSLRYFILGQRGRLCPQVEHHELLNAGREVTRGQSALNDHQQWWHLFGDRRFWRQCRKDRWKSCSVYIIKVSSGNSNIYVHHLHGLLHQYWRW